MEIPTLKKLGKDVRVLIAYSLVDVPSRVQWKTAMPDLSAMAIDLTRLAPKPSTIDCRTAEVVR
jgi:hypothetical protein